MCCFIDSSRSRYTPRSRTTVDGWIVDSPIWIEQSRVVSFARLDFDPIQIASVLLAFSWRRRDVHHEMIQCFLTKTWGVCIISGSNGMSAFIVSDPRMESHRRQLCLSWQPLWQDGWLLGPDCAPSSECPQALIAACRHAASSIRKLSRIIGTFILQSTSISCQPTNSVKATTPVKQKQIVYMCAWLIEFRFYVPLNTK